MLLLSFLPVCVGAQGPIEQIVDVPDEPEVNRVPSDPWSITFATASDAAEPVDPDSVSHFYIDAQVRSRGEYRYGQGTLHYTDAKPVFFVNERARFGLGFEQKLFSLKVSAQHTGVWGDRSIENNDGKGEFSLYEGWARVNLPVGFFLQAGRMVLSYDDQRIFGDNDWSKTGRSHDGFRFGYESGLHKVHGVLAYNQTNERTIGGDYYDGATSYKSMEALWYHYGKESSPLQFSVLGVNRKVESGTIMDHYTTNMQTVGAWIKYQNGGFYGKAEAYYQMGKDTLKKSVSAFLAGGRLGYQSKLVDVEIGTDYWSGSATDSIKNRVFNTMFGSDHEFFGGMDYFTRDNMPYTGAFDFNANVKVRPLPKLMAEIGYHYYLTGCAHPGLHRPLGQEINLHASWNIAKGVSLEAGYGMMMATSVMFYFKGGNNKSWQDWGWLTLNADLRAFSAKFKRK